MDWWRKSWYRASCEILLGLFIGYGLFLCVSPAFGACTPGSFDHGVPVGPNVKKQWLIDLGAPSSCFNSYEGAYVTVWLVVGDECVWDLGETPHWSVACGYDPKMLIHWKAPGCYGPPQFPVKRDVFYFNNWHDGTYDWDCDGVPDDQDPDPFNPGCSSDADADGICDDGDPWPNDPNCPGQSARWSWSRTYTAKDGSCTIHVYSDSMGECPSFYTTDGTCSYGCLPGQCPDNYWGQIIEGGEDHSYCELFPSACEIEDPDPGPDPNPDPTPPHPAEDEAILEELIKIRKNTGQDEGSLGNDIDYMTQVLGGKLDGIGEAIGELGEGGGGEWDPSPITTRQDTQTGVLDTIAGKLDDIKNGQVSLGDESLPDGDGEAFQDNSDIQGEGLTEKENEAKSDLSDLFDWWLENNPFAQIISDTHINASGGGSVEFSWGRWGSASVSAGYGEGALNIMGIGLVALSTLAGLVVVLRD